MYKIDMHVHTKEISSCGKVPASESVKLYKEAGYDGVIITDHFYKGYFEGMKDLSWKQKVHEYMAGYNTALKVGQEIGLDIFFGIEVRFDENANDYLVFGIDESFLIEHEYFYNCGLKKFKSIVKDKDILIYQAHPFRAGITAACCDLLDGVEVYNGNPRHDSKNDLAVDFAKSNNLRMISGSDFHQLQDLARGGLLLQERPTNIKELINILRNDSGIELIKSEA